jgi:hypothetical protein
MAVQLVFVGTRIIQFDINSGALYMLPRHVMNNLQRCILAAVCDRIEPRRPPKRFISRVLCRRPPTYIG